MRDGGKEVTEYSILPDQSLLKKVGATSFTVAEAAVELVANSIDARPEEQPLEIEVHVTPEQIRVIDDASGMDQDVLATAVTLGAQLEDADEERKGMYGLGLKTACASLGDYWAVHTRPIEEEREHVVGFDLTEWKQGAGGEESDWTVSIESRDPDPGGPLGERDHGTAVIIRRLREDNPLPGPVLAKLGAAYKPHLEQGDEIRVNGEQAHPPSYNLIEGKKFEVDEKCGDHRITGWVGLDKQTHNDEFFGLNLYRKGQLLAPWDKSWFKPHLMTSRIVGEVDLDFVPPNFYKKDFERQSEEWRDASKVMKEFMKPVASASRDASRDRKDKMKGAKAVKKLERTIGEDEGADDDQGEGEEEDSTGYLPSMPDDDVEIKSDTLKIREQVISLSYVLEDLEDERVPWDYLFDGSAKELQAVINTGSRIFEETDDHEFLGILALADCVVQFLENDFDYDSSKARELRNRWLYANVSK